MVGHLRFGASPRADYYTSTSVPNGVGGLELHYLRVRVHVGERFSVGQAPGSENQPFGFEDGHRFGGAEKHVSDKAQVGRTGAPKGLPPMQEGGSPHG